MVRCGMLSEEVNIDIQVNSKLNLSNSVKKERWKNLMSHD